MTLKILLNRENAVVPISISLDPTNCHFSLSCSIMHVALKSVGYLVHFRAKADENEQKWKQHKAKC